jgi:hypothetical protein
MEVQAAGECAGYADELQRKRKAIRGDRRGRTRKAGNEARRLRARVHVAVKMVAGLSMHSYRGRDSDAAPGLVGIVWQMIMEAIARACPFAA